MHIKVKNNGNKKAIDGAWLLNLGLHKAKQNDKFSGFIHPSIPFLWKETLTESVTARSLGVCTPLKITAGGSFFPSATTASVMVKLVFSPPKDFSGDSSAELKGLFHVKDPCPRSMRSTDVLVWQTDGTALFFPLNCLEDTAQGLFFVRRLMQWQRFHFWYQPRDALKSGSLAFNCGMKWPMQPIEPLG